MMRKLFGAFIWVVAFASMSYLLVQAKDAEIRQPAPAFTLTDIQGKPHSLSDYKGKFVVLEWTNPDCPFVKKHYESGNMQNLQKTWGTKDVVWLSVCSSGKGKQGNYSPEEWKGVLEKKNASPAAMLLDPEGSVGRAYGAKTTPHMFVIDPKGLLIYKGAIDDKRSADIEDVAGAKNFVSAALEEAMSGKPVKYSSTMSYGCSVKY